MAGDWRQKVTTGQQFTGFPAQLQNEMIDVITAAKRNQLPSPRTPRPNGLPEGIVKIQNNSGDDVDEFNVLGLDSVIITPDKNLPEFKRNTVYTGVTPTSDYTGQFAITWNAIPKGQIGLAWVFGECAVQINMANEDDLFADITPGDTTALTSGDTGIAQILFSESGTGKKWARIRFMGASGGSLPRVQYPGQFIGGASKDQIAGIFIFATAMEAD